MGFSTYEPDEGEDFKAIKKGDIVIVHWSDYFVRHHEGSKPVMAYHVYENKQRQREIICRLKGNHYFNWESYLEGRSNAEHVLLVYFGDDKN